MVLWEEGLGRKEARFPVLLNGHMSGPTRDQSKASEIPSREGMKVHSSSFGRKYVVVTVNAK
jgi:hypothetical protein